MSEREDEHFDIDDELLGEAEEAHDFDPLIERTERRPKAVAATRATPMRARFCGGLSAPCSLGRRGHLSIQADDGIQVSKTLDTCQDTVENLDTR